MVEVAGIEPASENLQRMETTGLSGFVEFRESVVRTGKCAVPLAPKGFGSDPGARVLTYPAIGVPSSPAGMAGGT
jgi:hypothetical protein